MVLMYMFYLYRSRLTYGYLAKIKSVLKVTLV